MTFTCSAGKILHFNNQLKQFWVIPTFCLSFIETRINHGKDTGYSYALVFQFGFWNCGIAYSYEP